MPTAELSAIIILIFTAKDNNNTSTTPSNPRDCEKHANCTISDTNKPISSCPEGFQGSPSNCKPECMRNSDCNLEQACLNYKCENPCTGVCGLNARCHVINHRPVCACSDGYTGDPFTTCSTAKTGTNQRLHDGIVVL